MSAVRLAACLTLLVGLVFGHGRLRDPPSRSSAWRDGFNTPPNWTDNELFCGGLTVLIKNGGKCGICGDPWTQRQPRDNELGGKYGKGIITRTYSPGQVIDVWVELTQNHLGWFEFRLCPLTNGGPNGVDATQECLDTNLLQIADGSGTRIPVPGGKKEFRFKAKLPENLSCDHCVFQWHYRTANTWNFCPNGNGGGALGCGPQEVFRGCADIKIE